MPVSGRRSRAAIAVVMAATVSGRSENGLNGRRSRRSSRRLSRSALTSRAVLGLIYDVHGNLEALEAVLADAGEAGVGRFLLGGDYALFGPQPAETSSGCARSTRR